MENEMMDEEQREALEMTREELLALEVSGKPARLAKKPPRRIRKRLKQARAVTKENRSLSR